MDKKSLKTMGAIALMLGTAYVVGKHIWEVKNEPIAVFKYSAETGELERIK
ncbi:hypothetical protein LGK97_16420 [Clostridium sp. CS001]|uniref:hypothetical protein n=1 Tax=Clostridium sp. CS001 TaxID=2880648 RepID=UPI001CF50829|nr:hypothetical protein [Clostridium sp. CS001]MCB2291313.1 hypothetical protein [Clostridium sp. CS001]